MAMCDTDTVYPIFDKKFESALSRQDTKLREHLEEMLRRFPIHMTHMLLIDRSSTLCRASRCCEGSSGIVQQNTRAEESDNHLLGQAPL